MFGSTFLLFGALLLSPASETTPDLRGPAWHGPAVAPAAAATVDDTQQRAELRDPFPAGRAVMVDGRRVVDATGLREPFEGRIGIAVARAPELASGELRPLGPGPARTPAVLRTPAAASDTVDPFVRRSAAAPSPAAPDVDGGGLRRPFGAS